MTKFISLYAIMVGISLLFYFVPVVFTRDFEILRWTSLAGFFCTILNWLVLARVFWLVALKHHVSYWLIAAFILVLGIPAWLLDYNAMRITFENGLYNWSADPLSAFFKGILVSTIVLPTGLYFWLMAFRSKGLMVRVKWFAFGAALLGAGGGDTFNYFFNNASDTIDSTRINLIVFSILLVVVALPYRLVGQWLRRR